MLKYPRIVFDNPADKALLHVKDVEYAYIRCKTVADGAKLKHNTAIRSVNAFKKLIGVMKVIPVTYKGKSYSSMYKLMCEYTVKDYAPVVTTARGATKQIAQFYAKFIKEELIGE